MVEDTENLSPLPTLQLTEIIIIIRVSSEKLRETDELNPQRSGKGGKIVLEIQSPKLPFRLRE